MKRRDFLLRSGVLSGAAAAGAFGAFTSLPSLAAGVPDALFSKAFPDVNGHEFTLSQWLGKPVVINFWATWCPPCVKEMPDLEALHKQFDGAVFLGLGVDTASNVRAFTEKVKVSYPLLLVGHGGIELMRSLGNKAGGLPFTVVFDASGQLKTHVLGTIVPQKLAQTVQDLLV